MATGSLVQPGRQLASIETDRELTGALEVSDRPGVSGGYADIYHGFWTNAQGKRVEVAVKELKTLVPRNQQTNQDELMRRAEMVGAFRFNLSITMIYLFLLIVSVLHEKLSFGAGYSILTFTPYSATVHNTNHGSSVLGAATVTYWTT